MKTNYFVISTLLAGLFVTASCSNEEIALNSSIESAPISEIIAAATNPQGADTRLVMEEGENNLLIKWKTEGEEISVMKGIDGTPVLFSQQSIGDDLHTATFKNVTPISVDLDAFYYSVYPTTNSANAANIELDMNGQDGTCMESKVYMYAKSQIENKKLNFAFAHLTSILKLTLQVYPYDGDLEANGEVTDIPATRVNATKLTNISFSASGLLTDAFVDISNETLVDVNGIVTYNESSKTEGNLTFGTKEFPLVNGAVTVYLHLLPNEVANLVVTAEDENGNEYSAEIGSKTLVAGTMYTNEVVLVKKEKFVHELGDILLSSGEWVHAAEVTDEQKAEAVGVVAYLYKEGDRRVTLPNGTSATGLVLALKNVGSSIKWRNEKATAVDYTETGEGNIDGCYQTLKEAYNNGADGYTISEAIKLVENWETIYPAFAAVQSYGTAVTGTTGWYLPSIGEWLNILGAEGIGGVQAVNNEVMTCETYIKSLTEQDNAAGNLNKYMDIVGNYDKFPLKSDNDMQWFWSASEGSVTGAYNVYFQYGYLDFNRQAKQYPNSYCRVRCILAF